MINLNEMIKMTAPAYIPQFMSGNVTFNKDYFYVTTISLEQMYLNKYKKRYYQSSINPFKVEVT